MALDLYLCDKSRCGTYMKKTECIDYSYENICIEADDAKQRPLAILLLSNINLQSHFCCFGSLKWWWDIYRVEPLWLLWCFLASEGKENCHSSGKTVGYY